MLKEDGKGRLVIEMGGYGNVEGEYRREGVDRKRERERERERGSDIWDLGCFDREEKGVFKEEGGYQE